MVVQVLNFSENIKKGWKMVQIGIKKGIFSLKKGEKEEKWESQALEKI